MVARAGDDRFFESTRGQIVALLRQSAKTVDELARELGLTDNAVRLHLGTLEKDGVVRAGSVRRGGGVGGRQGSQGSRTSVAIPSWTPGEDA